MVFAKKNTIIKGEKMTEITHITDRNFYDYYSKFKTMINVKNDIKMWLDEKKRTLPDWHEYGYDCEGNIHYRFLLDEKPQWQIKYPIIKEENHDKE